MPVRPAGQEYYRLASCVGSKYRAELGIHEQAWRSERRLVGTPAQVLLQAWQVGLAGFAWAESWPLPDPLSFFFSASAAFL